MVPRSVHMIFGLTPDFGGKPFSLVHYIAVESVLRHIRPESLTIYYRYEPTGPWWDETMGKVRTCRIRPRTRVGDRELRHPAHIADLARLEILYEQGGIYLDLDTICVRSFDDLMHHDCVLGIEYTGEVAGLCNAVIVAAPGAEFLKRWIDGFYPGRSMWGGFRSSGRDRFWGEYSVRYPGFLAARFPDEVHLEPPESFFWPSWTEAGLKALFEREYTEEDAAGCKAYSFHLWESKSWDRYLSRMSVDGVRTDRSLYAFYAKRCLATSDRAEAFRE